MKVKTKGKDVKVAIIDTRINSDIDPLKNKLKNSHDWTGEGDMIGNDLYLTQDLHGHTEHGHGTSIASVITYIAPDAKLLNYKAMSAFSGKASSHDKDNVIDAINKSVTDGADIINLSLGFDACIDGCCAICQAVDNAVKAGLNVVAAMGNTHRTVKSPPDCPAQARSAMSVAASTKSDTI